MLAGLVIGLIAVLGIARANRQRNETALIAGGIP
jgi:hypothetical protein